MTSIARAQEMKMMLGTNDALPACSRRAATRSSCSGCIRTSAVPRRCTRGVLGSHSTTLITRTVSRLSVAAAIADVLACKPLPLLRYTAVVAKREGLL
jgi:hypothetical protein